MVTKKTKVLFHFKILTLVLGVLVVLLSVSCWKLMKSPTPRVEFFFTQTANEGALIPEYDGSNVYHLTMINTPKKVNFISNAPERYYGTVMLDKFINLWKADFAVDHPNASLVVYDAQKQPHSYDLQLIDAKLDPQSNNVIYTTKLLSPYPPIADFKEASLFVDTLDIKVNFINQSSDAGAGILIFQKNPVLSSQVPDGW